MNVEPSSATLETDISPPCISTSCLTRLRPMPVPAIPLAVEARKNRLNSLLISSFRNTNAFITNRDDRIIAVPMPINPDRRCAGGIFDSVREQVGEDLSHQLRVGDGSFRQAIDVENNLMGVVDPFLPLGGLGQHLDQVAGARIEFDGACFKPGRTQDAFDQANETGDARLGIFPSTS